MTPPKHDTPTTDPTLRDAMHHAVLIAESKKANVDSCPECKEKAALLSIVFRGIRVGRLCRFCPFTTFATTQPRRVAKKKAVAHGRLRAVK